jgi:hypothetical protein
MQLYSCDLDALLAALEHLLAELAKLAVGEDDTDVQFWTRQIWRDLMSAFMLWPVPRCIELAPSVPRMLSIANPDDNYNLLAIALYHRQLWWAKNTHEAMALAVAHYTDRDLLLTNTLAGARSRAPDGGAAQRSGDAATQRRAAMLLRHAVARQQVWPGGRPAQHVRRVRPNLQHAVPAGLRGRPCPPHARRAARLDHTQRGVQARSPRQVPLLQPLATRFEFGPSHPQSCHSAPYPIRWSMAPRQSLHTSPEDIASRHIL